MVPAASNPKFLLSTGLSRALDSEAQSDWGFHVYSLIEAAGRACAQTFAKSFPCFFEKGKITVFAGTGNNGADAMVMLRFWILSGLIESSSSALVASRSPKSGESEPWARLYRSLEKMNVPIFLWDDTSDEAVKRRNTTLSQSDIIIDGIAGTGLSAALRGTALEMVNTLNFIKRKPVFTAFSNSKITHYRSVSEITDPQIPVIVSIDLPSGNSDDWEDGMPIVEADFTLAIEPQKYCVYTPSARIFAGTIIPIEGIFPKEIMANYSGAELLNWDVAKARIPGIRQDAYKNMRGTVEVRAGSPGATGAALITARGAQAAGAGLIRIVADDEIYPILASRAGGIMVSPVSLENADCKKHNFPPDAMVLGPGWGKVLDRSQVLEKALLAEKSGVPLILDADAIELVRDTVFNGNAILTPHPGELSSKYAGIEQKELLNHPAPILQKLAFERKATILFKSHVITIAAPDGRIGVLDGMAAGLASGGSGDLLAGFCGAIAARMAREKRFDAYDCAAAAAALLIATGKSGRMAKRFTDPLELADAAADMAGSAWLGQEENQYVR